MIVNKTTPQEIFVQEGDESKTYNACLDTATPGVVKYLREDFVPNDEEMLEFAKKQTFRLDDRLVPYSRVELRARSWLEGYYFAKLHQVPIELPVLCEPEKKCREYKIDEINEALLSEVLPCFMHGGEADEVVAKLEEVLREKAKNSEI